MRRRQIPMNQYTKETAADFVGQELGVSEWITIDQERIDAFADATGDHQWIHVDVERARAESPLGTTIAHGYLTLALLPGLTGSLALFPAGTTYALNYGTDKIRFVSPVRAGDRIRARVSLSEVTPRGDGRLLLKTTNTVEIEGEEKPAMIAELLVLIV